MQAKSRVLVVDDDTSLLKTVAELLEASYNISLSESGETALRLLERGLAPDIILLDVAMPRISGYELIARLRSHKQAAETPIIFLTGRTTPEDEVRGLELGAVDYIKKPIVREVLLTRIKAHLNMSRRLKGKSALDEEKLRGLAEPLTERELEVARLLAQFYTNEEICQALHYSLPYIKKLVSAVLAKLGLEGRNEIRRYAK